MEILAGRALPARPYRPPDAHFRIGSVTKIFISSVVLQLAAEGRQTLDNTVQQLIPGLRATVPSP
ncbi:serine hydrolase [Streptomyces sp. NPDC058694]|uniref:serine hydrolase n=1 Tax=Streptomyces sp. NPDC058694 TaxID=3346603 RepID=UPI0036680611